MSITRHIAALVAALLITGSALGEAEASYHSVAGGVSAHVAVTARLKAEPMRWLTAWHRLIASLWVTADHTPRPQRVRVAILADMNGSYGSTRYKPPVHAAVEALVEDLSPSLVLSTGDMVAGMKAGLDYEAMWEAFHQAVTEPLLEAGLPFAPTPGNHDATNRPRFEREREVYAETWRAHRPEVDFLDDEHYPRRYAFTHQGILFISIDASTVGALSKTQRAWLKALLEAHADIPVKVVYGHVPLYAFARGREKEILGDEALEAMFERHGVSLYLSGHHHAYYPARRPSGLRLVSMACLGGGPRALIGREPKSEPEPRALTILEIDPERGVLSVEAYGAAGGFTEPIARATLPERLGEGRAQMVRDDLWSSEERAVTAQEETSR